MVFYDKYNDFFVFEATSVRLILSILYRILDYNRDIDPTEDQQFLCFFEPLLEKAAAITKIQQAIRARLFRNRCKIMPVKMIIQRRASYCIQEWWSNMKFKKRMKALANIAKHAKRINSSTLYLEQSIYNNIEEVVNQAHVNFRFKEQAILFDFNPEKFTIHMRIDEPKNEHGKYRFGSLAVPEWYGVNLTPPNFMETPYQNHLQALFHFTHGDCQILPATSVLNYNRCRMNIDTNLYFVQI